MSPAMRGLVHGVLLGASRLKKRGVFVVAGTVGVALVVALVQRALGPMGAVDRSLGALSTWIAPIGVAALVTAVLGLRTPRDLAWPVARWGAPRVTVSLGVLVVLGGAAAIMSAAAGAVMVVAAHSSAGVDAPIGSDAVTTAGVSALVGWVYAAALSFGGTFGRRGGGRAIVLGLDFVVGGLGVVGFLLPRGHGASLLGLTTMPISQRGSSVALVVLGVAWTALAALRSRD